LVRDNAALMPTATVFLWSGSAATAQSPLAKSSPRPRRDVTTVSVLDLSGAP